MVILKKHIGFSQGIIVLALIAAFGQAQAEEVADNAQTDKPGSAESGRAEQVASIVMPAKLEGWMSFGLSGASDERALFGQYNGLRDNNGHFLLDAGIVNQNEVSGIWTTLQGRNLGLDNRELRFSQQKQGDWKYSAEYNELTRHDPRTINTGVKGIETANLIVDSLAAKADVNLQTKRKSVSVAAEKWLAPDLQFEASLKSEDKKGARLFGRGYTCGAYSVGRTSNLCSATTGAILMLPEPIDSNTKQLDARLNFSGDKYLVSAAYYGSYYTNAFGSLNPTVSGNLSNPNGSILDTTVNPGAQLAGYLQQTMALPPDNQAHQYSLDGNYAFTPTTRANFKYARTHATQHENFASMGLGNSPAGVSDLGGVVDTTLTQLGLTARPMAKLSLLANLRYENKDDRTPLHLYSQMLTATTPTYTAYTNSTEPLKKLVGKLEASYQLPDNYRATLGADYETVNRGVPESTVKPGGLSMLREETRELGWRAELRRSMSDTFNAGISYLSSLRNGSSWLNATVVGTPVLSDAAAAALSSGAPNTSYTTMDRQRDKLRLSADWSPTESLSLQLMVEEGKDKYTEPHTAVYARGLNDTGVRLYSIDAAYTLSDMWRLTGYVSHGEQITHVNFSYRAELINTNTALGIGVRGMPIDELEVGGDIAYVNDKNRYGQLQVTTTALPDVTFRQATLSLFSKYSLDEDADIRVDLLRQHTSLNEWTWQNGGTPFFYSDTSTVSMAQTQNVAYIGATYNYKLK